MILSPKNKFAFFRVPKTGSSTAAFFLNISRLPLEDDYTAPMPAFGIGDPIVLKKQDPKLEEIIHATPEIAMRHGLVTMDQLREYECFGYVRDPYARLVSGLVHGMGPRTIPQLMESQLEDIGYEGIVKRFTVLVSKQVDYHFANGEQVLTPLLMSDYEANLRMMLKKFGGIDFPIIPHLNSRQVARSHVPKSMFITPILKSIVENHYAEDLELFNEVKRNAGKKTA